MATVNPWLKVDLNSTEIIADDQKEKDDIRNLAKTLKGNPDYALHLDSVPEPFWGDIVNADVFILSGNPGYGDDELEKSFIGNTELINKTRDNLEQISPTNPTSPNLLWLDPVKLIKNDEEKLHPGYQYWEGKTKELRETIAEIQGNCNPANVKLNICIIEYFPYHSKKISDEMIDCAKELPSSKFVNDYIEKAIKNKKWIVILRCKSEWLKRIKGLKEYKKKYSDKVLIAKGQRMFITSGNLKREIDMNSDDGAPTWNAFVKACTK